METLREYYAAPQVGARLREYCGASASCPPTCVFLCGMTAFGDPHATWGRAPRFPMASLDDLMAKGADVARSMWDTENLLVHFDFDYQNSSVPGQAFFQRADAFFKMEPAYRAARHVMRRFGLPLYVLTTGRGYHFTGRVPLRSEAIDRLADLIPDPPRWLDAVPARSPAWTRATIAPRHARAYAGGGMIAEFLAHRMLRRAARRTTIPIVLNGTVVGSGATARDCVSIDLSYAGDPLDLRHLRLPFSAYQKHRLRPDLVSTLAATRPPFVAVPRGDESLAHLLSHGRDFRHAARAARSRAAALPDVTDGVSRVLDAYAASRLARFHREFYATPARSDGELEGMLDTIDVSALPDCVRHPLLAPNDLLLQPAVIQHVTRALMADGVAPREVAAIVHSRYARDFGWGRRWQWLDPRTRAEFDVRVFAGLLTAGVDRAIDFNCRSAQEKNLCPGGRCTRDLRDDRARLLRAVG